MTQQFAIERLTEILSNAQLTKRAHQKSIEIDRMMALRVLQWVQIDFEKNPSADNYQRMELAMQHFQHWMKNVRPL